MTQLKAATISNAGSAKSSRDCFLSGSYVPDRFAQETAGRANVEYNLAATTKHTVSFAVFDGVQRSDASGITAWMAAKELEEEINRSTLLPLPEIEALIRRFVSRANEHISQSARIDRALADAGTYFTCLCLHGNQASIFQVGKSRAFLLRQGKLQLMNGTVPAIDQENYLGLPAGKKSASVTSTGIFQLEDHDRILLFSDGLTEALDEETIKTCLLIEDPQAAAGQLISKALARNIRDSVTVTVIALSQTEQHPANLTHLTESRAVHPHIEHQSKKIEVPPPPVEKLKIDPEKMKFRPFSFWTMIPGWLQLVLSIGFLLLLLLLLWILYPQIF